MILMFLIGGIAALPMLIAATDGVTGISSFSDFAAVGDPFIWREQDNGIGIPNELIDNLFYPFVTTKSTGTGLGLAFVAKAISDHGGFVEVESMPRLTNFRVMLPKFEPKVFPSTSDHPFQEYLKPGEFP